jgi:hypothetical protein
MADTIDVAAFTAACSAIAGGTGFLISYFLAGRREDRTKRLQLTLEHTSSQIREFYAPLVALTDQLNTTAKVKEELFSNKGGEDRRNLELLFYNTFFLPIHNQISDIIKTKVHLLEGDSIPDSFQKYFGHFTSERAYYYLTERQIDLSGVVVSDYPPKFYWDVRRGFDEVTTRYENSLKELRHSDLPIVGLKYRRRINSERISQPVQPINPRTPAYVATSVTLESGEAAEKS